MADVLDRARPVPPVTCPIEPDECACMTQATVRPVAVYQRCDDTIEDYEVVANTLVFTSPQAVLGTRLDALEPTPLNSYERILPVVGSYRPGNDLSVVGVAYGGVESANDAKQYPDAKGRIVVQVTGTVTCTVHPGDLRELNVGDLLALTGKHHEAGMTGMPHVRLPQIKKYTVDKNAWLMRLLISRARSEDPRYSVSAFSLAAVICSFYREKPWIALLWESCQRLLENLRKTTRPISEYTVENEHFVDFFSEFTDKISSMDPPHEESFTNSKPTFEVLASVFMSVEELDYMHTVVAGRLPLLEDKNNFAQMLEQHVSSKMPFGYMLEPGHNSARILLKPGVTL